MSANILVVEDNPDNRRLVAWILEEAGYRVSCHGSAETGIEALKTESFDLILMDISLPGLSGIEATRTIRQIESLKKLPVIALTALSSQEEHEAIMASGVTELMIKPLDEKFLFSRIATLVSTQAHNDPGKYPSIDRRRY